MKNLYKQKNTILLMQEAIKIEATDDHPKVELDRDKKIFIIAGRSLPEDANRFYNPIKEWIINYLEQPNNETEFILKMEYMNSASVRKLTEILFELEKLQSLEKSITVTWFYKPNDEIMKERGEEIKNVVELPFHLRTEKIAED